MDLRLDFSRKPSALAFMARAFLPRPPPGPLPELRVGWRGHRVQPSRLAELLRLTTLGAEAGLPILYPHVLGFPLLMVALTHPAFPFPIWRVLQVRNHLLLRRALSADERLDFQVRLAAHRTAERGDEVDLHTTVEQGGQAAWESLNTFYVRRGRPASGARAVEHEPRLAVVARWQMPATGGLRFARLTGDYNGLHLWSGWARRFGFEGALFHPPLVIGQCLARLRAPGSTPQRLDTWLKGPVLYGSPVTLRAAGPPEHTVFTLTAGAERRPALIGRWQACSAAPLEPTAALQVPPPEATA